MRAENTLLWVIMICALASLLLTTANFGALHHDSKFFVQREK